MSDEITFDEFCKVLRSEVEKWERDWRANSESEPEQYPSEMAEGDWWEQFISGFMT